MIMERSSLPYIQYDSLLLLIPYSVHPRIKKVLKKYGKKQRLKITKTVDRWVFCEWILFVVVLIN